ncbi:unnamed protein product [Ambrosiozyma monospora]|uniref:Unnamed protein product n=1 Tax=Ambrosiozyma monospora TaxID=43982 RepID=A0ACB5TXX5_AMBMO|nr:unnamed protein product [Ambrosiozyma monospora]
MALHQAKAKPSTNDPFSSTTENTTINNNATTTTTTGCHRRRSSSADALPSSTQMTKHGSSFSSLIPSPIVTSMSSVSTMFKRRNSKSNSPSSSTFPISNGYNNSNGKSGSNNPKSPDLKSILGFGRSRHGSLAENNISIKTAISPQSIQHVKDDATNLSIVPEPSELPIDDSTPKTTNEDSNASTKIKVRQSSMSRAISGISSDDDSDYVDNPTQLRAQDQSIIYHSRANSQSEDNTAKHALKKKLTREDASSIIGGHSQPCTNKHSQQTQTSYAYS